MSPIAVLDFEGTSRLASARATEIGVVSLDRNLAIDSEFETLVGSPIKADKSALSVSRLSNREIEDAPSFEELWPLIRMQISGKVLVAHNRTYEENVLRNELKRLSISMIPPFFCTLEWSRKILGLKVSNHTLPTLCDYFGIELSNAHEALSDARATALLLAKLAERSPEVLQSLSEMEAKSFQYPGVPQSQVRCKTRDRYKARTGDSEKISLALERIIHQKKILVVLTGMPDSGKEDFGILVASVGLEYRETPPTKGTAFVVQANNSPGMSKIRKALELGLPVLSEDDALLLVNRLRRR